MNTTNVFKKNLIHINNNKTIICNEGGTRSSKTYSILQLLIYFMYKGNMKHKTISVVSESLPHLKRGAMKDTLDIIKTEGLYDEKFHNKTDNKYTINTNTIEFFGAEDYTKVTGAGRDFLFLNECNNVNWQVFQQLQMRTKILTFLDWNPTSTFWFHEYLKDQDNVGYIHSTYKDNQFVSKNTIELLNSMKDKDPNFYKVYALGQLGSLEGLIFNFTIDTFESSEKKVYGLDFGYTNDPTTLVSVDLKDNTLYIEELLYKQGLTNQDISNHFIQLGLRKNKDIIYADQAEPKSIEELHRLGWVVKPAIKGPDSILKGIDTLKTYKLVVSKQSLNLIKELRNYQWLKDKDGKYINKPVGIDHCLSKDTIIKTKDGDKLITNVKINDEVLTSIGYKKVLKSGISGFQQLYNYKINNNIDITCTDNHKIKTKEGWKQINHIQKGDILYQHKNLMVEYTNYTNMKDIMLMVKEDYIGMFGNFTTVKLKRDFIYIILIIIKKIIQLKILNWLNHSNIYQNTVKNIIKIIKKKFKKIWITSDHLQKNGIVVKKVKNGIKNTLNNLILDIKNLVYVNVKSVEKKLKKEVLQKSSVPITVNQNIDYQQELITSLVNVNIAKNNLLKTNILNVDFVQEVVVYNVLKNKLQEDVVYDLEIEDIHEFIANNIIVHNSVDALRYAVSSHYGIKKNISAPIFV